eukprot:TRINITY_DN6567_c0_g2_i2.p1 TRINITY_DN6567_c0_g2~~TRINITY_DN6567_c0_g2_i2.p1  ORF type:complete len:437 (-),score=-8.53 TRINITY_DN6567_c0_g2_i2:183-1493(-)
MGATSARGAMPRRGPGFYRRESSVDLREVSTPHTSFRLFVYIPREHGTWSACEGGVGVLVRKGVTVRTVRPTSTAAYEALYDTRRVVHTMIHRDSATTKRGRWVHIIVMYGPSGDETEAIDLQDRVWQYAASLGEVPILVMGDFNVDLDESPLCDAVRAQGWVDAAAQHAAQRGQSPEPTTHGRRTRGSGDDRDVGVDDTDSESDAPDDLGGVLAEDGARPDAQESTPLLRLGRRIDGIWLSPALARIMGWVSLWKQTGLPTHYPLTVDMEFRLLAEKIRVRVQPNRIPLEVWTDAVGDDECARSALTQAKTASGRGREEDGRYPSVEDDWRGWSDGAESYLAEKTGALLRASRPARADPPKYMEVSPVAIIGLPMVLPPRPRACSSFARGTAITLIPPFGTLRRISLVTRTPESVFFSSASVSLPLKPRKCWIAR